MSTAEIEPEAIHGWFGLSYANYLTLPRTLLQSMPDEWQNRFVACLEEARDAFAHIPQAEAYEVHAATEHVVVDMSDEQRAAAGIAVDWYGGEEPPKGVSDEDLAEWEQKHEQDIPTYYDRHGDELNSGHRILLRTDDPVPHYNRGRTHIEPRVAASVPSVEQGSEHTGGSRG